jgi:DNA-binding NarL/FixJ family response regulator
MEHFLVKIVTNRTRRPIRPILRGNLPNTGSASDPTAVHRQMMADFCRTIGASLRGQPSSVGAEPAVPADLSPRLRQTLQRLLEGDSEKQIAIHLGLSRNTVHVYVKSLYKRFAVQSRAELLARFVRPGIKL